MPPPRALFRRFYLDGWLAPKAPHSEAKEKRNGTRKRDEGTRRSNETIKELIEARGRSNDEADGEKKNSANEERGWSRNASSKMREQEVRWDSTRSEAEDASCGQVQCSVENLERKRQGQQGVLCMHRKTHKRWKAQGHDHSVKHKKLPSVPGGHAMVDGSRSKKGRRRRSDKFRLVRARSTRRAGHAKRVGENQVKTPIKGART